RQREGPRRGLRGPSSSTWVNYPGWAFRELPVGRVASVGEALARGGREHVGLARSRHDVQRRALLRDPATLDADDEILGLAADLGGAVDVAVGAELLDDVHGDRETGRLVLGGLRQGARGAAVLLDDVEVLGTDADG